MKPIIISVINHKGGVGKTTTTVNISAGLAKLGKKVLTIDLDTQMNLTHSLIGDLDEKEINITEAILNDKISLKDIIKPTLVDNLQIAPSGESMIDLDLKLHSCPIRREYKLKDALKNDLISEYDFILIDNPPYISFTTVNSLIASNYYLVPVSAEYLPLVGIRHLIKTIELIKPSNPSISNLGYLLTMVNRRESISSGVENILRGTFPEDMFENVIRFIRS
ncbi:ParA family protein [Candidatus Protochlamydia sp. W-9]|uniref:ParA family protein n=1 Tax=Candidatus Protochlamydia sp. W-9 TaxID=1785087 RepID=UPI00096A85FE|nr:AAA family ATPase [Candidatus Protochlamydia sp. W-9]